MCEFIKVEDLATNAFIEISDDEISLDVLEKYGNAVIKELNKRGKTAALLMSRNYISLVSERSDFFKIEGSTIKIRNNRDETVKELIKIRHNMAQDLVEAYTSYKPKAIICGELP